MKRLMDPTAVALATLLTLAVSLSTSPKAMAEEAAPTPARELFLEGRKLAAEGKHEEACPKFEKSLRLELGIGTQFNLADCWERIGRTASAHALFLGAAASAKAVGQTDREQVLRERATALEPRLTRLVVDVDDTDPKLSVTRGDLPLEAESFGKALPVDPGKYVFAARAPGKQPWEQAVEIEPGAPVVKIRVPKLEPEEPEQPSAAPTKKLAPPPPRDPQQSDRSPPLNYKALSVGVLGIGSLAVGTAMGFQYMSANDSAKAVCPSGTNCTRAELNEHARFVKSARSARTWSYVGFAAGTVTLAGAAALWIFDNPKPAAKAEGQKRNVSWSAAPLVGADSTLGAAVAGSF